MYLSTAVKENVEPGSFVLQVSATDPDGPNGLIKYSLDIGAKDNFVIDERSGVVTVSNDAILDIQENGELYRIQVQAVDRGKPFGQSAVATITVDIEDVNDKSPKLEKDAYTEYVLESVPVGQPVLKVIADDLDRNANLYNLLNYYTMTCQIFVKNILPAKERHRLASSLCHKCFLPTSKTPPVA